MVHFWALKGKDEGLELRIERDGQFDLKVWVVAAVTAGVDKAALGEVRVSVDDDVVFTGRPVESCAGYWRTGGRMLGRGIHVVKVEGVATERVLFADDEALVSGGKAELLWENRNSERSFDNRRYELTDERRAMLMRHGFLIDHFEDAARCEVPSGVPLGGIGAGKVELTPEGLFTALTTNNNQDCPIYRLPGCFFAVRTEPSFRPIRESSLAPARLMQSVAVDQRIAPAARLEGDAAFPEMGLVMRDPNMPLRVSLHAFSPHVPHNVKDSSLPCVFFRFTIENPGEFVVREPKEVAVCFSWENVVNVGGHMRVTNQNPAENPLPVVYHTWNNAFTWSNRKRNYQETVRTEGGTGVRLASKDDGGNPSSFGEFMIWTPEDATAAPDRDIVADEIGFSRWFVDGCKGEFVPRGTSEFRAGALIVKKTLQPGETGTVDFVLAWHMPHYVNTSRQDTGVYYANHFGSAAEVLRYAWPERERLLRETLGVRELLEDSTLPEWFQRNLCDSRFTMNTGSLFDKAGRFSINEGPGGMCGCMGTLDQRTVSGFYTTAFYPELDAVELDMFRQRQTPDGRCPHDLGSAEFRLDPAGFGWPDLCCSYVMQVHRRFARTGERAFLELHYPHVVRAMGYSEACDETGHGVPTLRRGRGTTYDNQHWDGLSSFMASMQEAGWTLAADLADRMGDEANAAKWRALAVKANATRQECLWVKEGDGGYFRNANDMQAGKADDSCFICSFAGEWAMGAAGFRPRLPREMVRHGMESIRRKNMSERGMMDQSARPGYGAFIQYPVAYYGAAALMAGHADLAWDFMRLQDAIVTTPPSSRFNQVLTYGPDGGILGLPYYMTAPATWAFLDAVTGVAPDVERGVLRLAPRAMPGAAGLRVPVFVPTSWFVVDWRAEGDTVSLRLEPAKRVAAFDVKRLVVEAPDAARVRCVEVDGRKVKFEAKDGAVEVSVGFDPGRDGLRVVMKY